MVYIASYSPYYLEHHGILGQKWGIRRYQNPDGTLTAEGRRHKGIKEDTTKSAKEKAIEDTKTNAIKAVKRGLLTSKTNALAYAACTAGCRMLNSASGARLLGPLSKGTDIAFSALRAGRISNNVAHMAGMLAGKSALGETLFAAKATAKAARIGAKVTYNLIKDPNTAKMIGDSLIAATYIADGAAMVGMILTGVSIGKTVYSAGKAIKEAHDEKKKEHAG